MDWTGVTQAAEQLAAEWREQRSERQARRHLERADFDRLREIGFLAACTPTATGGLWEDTARSTRPIADILRTLAGGDPSVALVTSMHPAVLGFWLASDNGPSEWLEQREAVFATAAKGDQWGTITSEPGSGGDIAKTKARAAVDRESAQSIPGAGYRITGDKHFGSGSGVTQFMITSGLPEDGDRPALFAIDVRDRPWDGSSGMKLLAEWDGIGMAATQSHAMRLESCPATRLAWPGTVEELAFAAGPLISSLFTAVVLGVLDEALKTAKAQLAPKAESMRAYEQVEWSRAELDHWVAVQAFEGALRAVESGDPVRALYGAVRAKAAVAELAEQCLSRLTRVIGGGTFSRRSPFASWAEDVRALGFLRPPWGLAYDGLFLSSLI